MKLLKTLCIVIVLSLTQGCSSLDTPGNSDAATPVVFDTFDCPAPRDTLPDPQMGTLLIVAVELKKQLIDCRAAMARLKQGVAPYVNLVAKPQ